MHFGGIAELRHHLHNVLQVLEQIKAVGLGCLGGYMMALVWAPSALLANSHKFLLSKHFDGKRNWLFTGSERAGKRAAAIHSLLATAALNGLDPAARLRSTLEKLPTCFNSEIDSLLPLRQPTLLDYAD